MPVVETIYTPTAKDYLSGVRQTRFVGVFAVNTAAATTVVSGSSFVCPPDTARWLTGWSWSAVGGAAQNLNIVQLLNAISGSFNLAAQMMPSYRTAAVLMAGTMPLDMLLLPGETLTMQAVFDSGVAGNTMSGFVWGYDIPRANISA